MPTIFALVTSFVLSLFLLMEVRTRVNEMHEADAAGKATAIGVEVWHTLWTWASITTSITAPMSTSTAAPPPRMWPDMISITSSTSPCGPTRSPRIMLSMVTFVSSLVAIYAIGYMHDDPGYWRFFTYVSLFVFSMTMLVSVSNFVLLYVFWEAVGVCSYLLVGFWYEKPRRRGR